MVREHGCGNTFACRRVAITGDELSLTFAQLGVKQPPQQVNLSKATVYTTDKGYLFIKAGDTMCVLACVRACMRAMCVRRRRASGLCCCCYCV